MLERRPSGAASSVEARTYLVRAAALAVGVLAILTVVGVGLFLRGDLTLRPAAERGGEDLEFRRNASAILDRFDALASSVDQLLAEHESNPSAQSDPTWQQRYSAAVSEAHSLRSSADALSAPEADQQALADLSYGLGVYATGLELLQTGFGQGGHGAYYYGSHGNWDLNLGVQRLQEVRQFLSAP